MGEETESPPFGDLGGYTVIREGGREGIIGRGGSGNVYIARHKEDPETYVALKLIPVDPDNPLAMREVAAARHSRDLAPSPYLIQILDSDLTSCKSWFWYTMPLADDRPGRSDVSVETYEPQTLARRLARMEADPVWADECLEIAQRICAGIAALEARAHAHLDLKPGNILYRDHAVEIADIGLMTTRKKEIPRVSNPYYAFYGTHHADDTNRNLMDLSALGALMVQLLTRSTEPPMALLKPPSPPPGEPNEELWHTLFHLATLVQNDRKESFRTVREMADALEALARGKYEPASRLPAVHPLRVAILFVVGTLTALYLIYRSASNGEGESRPAPKPAPIVIPPMVTSSPAPLEQVQIRGAFAVAAYQDHILISGGGSRSGDTVDHVYAFNPELNQYTLLKAMPKARRSHRMAVVGHQAFVLGGRLALKPVMAVKAFDVKTGTWSEKASMKTARQYFSCAVLNGEIYVFGGGYEGR
ncbi:MAG: protein kinase, partial [Verrucomicrobiota bacterium]